MASASPVLAPIAWVNSSTRPRWIRSAMTPLNGPSTIMGAERAKAVSPTMNGEPVSSQASQPSTTRSIQRAVLRQRPESQRRRYACSRRISTTAGRATSTPARGAALLTRSRIARNEAREKRKPTRARRNAWRGCESPCHPGDATEPAREVVGTSLPARPLGPALLHERARALEAVLGRAQEHGEVRLEPEAVGERQSQPAHDRLLRIAKRDRRLLRDRPRERERRGHQLGDGHHALDQTD